MSSGKDTSHLASETAHVVSISHQCMERKGSREKFIFCSNTHDIWTDIPPGSSLQGLWRESTCPGQVSWDSLRLCQLCFITYMPFPLCLLARKVTHTQVAATLTILTFYHFWPLPIKPANDNPYTEATKTSTFMCLASLYTKLCYVNIYISVKQTY